MIKLTNIILEIKNLSKFPKPIAEPLVYGDNTKSNISYGICFPQDSSKKRWIVDKRGSIRRGDLTFTFMDDSWENEDEGFDPVKKFLKQLNIPYQEEEINYTLPEPHIRKLIVVSGKYFDIKK